MPEDSWNGIILTWTRATWVNEGLFIILHRFLLLLSLRLLLQMFYKDSVGLFQDSEGSSFFSSSPFLSFSLSFILIRSGSEKASMPIGNKRMVSPFFFWQNHCFLLKTTFFSLSFSLLTRVSNVPMLAPEKPVPESGTHSTRIFNQIGQSNRFGGTKRWIFKSGQHFHGFV